MFPVVDCDVADVMVRLNNVPVRLRSGLVPVGGGVGWGRGCETARMEAWGVEGHSVGPWKLGDVGGEGDETPSVMSESGSAK